MTEEFNRLAGELDHLIPRYSSDQSIIDASASALRTLASQEKQEPLGWIDPDGKFSVPATMTKECFLSLFHEAEIGTPVIAVYTAPPIPQPAPGWDSVNVSRDVLLTLISALDCALGDTDPSIAPDYTDEEVKRDYPVFWVCQQLSALRTLVRSKPTDTVATVVVKPFGHHFWKSNGDGTESPDFCEGEIPSWKKGVRNVTPLYTNQPLAVEAEPGDLVKCEACFGTGRHMGRFSMNDPDCTYCRGKGKVRP